MSDGKAQKQARAAAEAARQGAQSLACAATSVKRKALHALAADIRANSGDIVTQNRKDMDSGGSSGLSAALLDRLLLDEARIEGIAASVEEIAALDDPVGEIGELRRTQAGLGIGRMRTPIGVVLVIYESRPGVTVDAAALCLMSGNGAVLRGGSEAKHSNAALAACVHRALGKANLPASAINVMGSTDRAVVSELLKLNGLIDVVIPRGGKGLIKAVSEQTSITVIKHLDGNCHVFVDESADVETALPILANAKMQRPGVCNAMETLLVHRNIADRLLPRLEECLAGVELRGCPETAAAIGDACVPATDADWDTEYLDLILAVKVVDGIDEAVAHIARHGSGHTDAIITESQRNLWRFLREIDSSSVIANASTRFADGGIYGLGAEIGISTDRIHVRGPVGVRALTVEKWIVLGEGQVRE